MRLLLVLVLLASTAEAQRGGGRFDRTNSRCSQGRSDRGLPCDDLAFFEFAPSSGAGMGTACACTTPTGARGETLTFTRTGNATCSKQGLATTGIANGDLVVCSGNQPRVESSGGVLGLRVEGARTNNLVRSEEIDNAAWVKQGSGPPAAPTIAANSSVAPDTTTTADTVAFPAVSTATTFSIAYNQFTGTAAAWSCSVYVRGVSTSGTVYAALTPNSAAFNTTACSFTNTSWNRCLLQNVTLTAAPWFFQVGTDLRDGAQASTPAQDVLVWGAQCEVGAYATSYIPTTSAAVTRNAETATVTLSPDRTDTTICLAATIAPLWATSGQVPAFGTVVGRASPISLISFPSGAPRMFTSAGSTGVFQAGTQRLIGRDDNVNVTLSVNGTTTSTAAGASADRWTTALDIGSGASGAAIDAIVYRVQADPSPTRCTP